MGQLASTQTNIGTNWTKVNLTAEIDPGSYWDGTNHYWNPKIAGTYLICAGAQAAAGTALPNLTAALSKNGTIGSGTAISSGVNVGLATATSQGVIVPCSMVAMNGSTDTVELDVIAAGSTGQVDITASVGTTMVVTRISN